MLTTIKEKSLSVLENIYNTLEASENTQQRPMVFSMRKNPEVEDDKNLENMKHK